VATVSPGPEYGADVLVEAFARIAAAPGMERAGLVVFGPAGRSPALAADVAAAGLAGRVHHYADLERAEALALLRAADVFVRPTRADGDAVSVREALALGRPVVASDAAARPEGTLCFPAGDAAALARAVDHALAAPPPAPLRTDALGAVLACYARLGLALDPVPSTTEATPAGQAAVAGA
jgi:glycosyltransferase involved in cell wall biosynthesis